MAGSVVGHGISNMLFGGRSAEQAPPPAEYANQARETTGNCDIPAKGMFHLSCLVYYSHLVETFDLRNIRDQGKRVAS
jgi:hypothetical protein